MTTKSQRIIVLTDLDDSLFQTLKKIPEGVSSTPVATDRDNNPLSYMTNPQRIFFDMLVNSGAEIIPITGRNTDALERVNLPFGEYSSVSHGAIVLDKNNQVCAQWLQWLNIDTATFANLLDDINDRVQTIIHTQSLNARSRVIVDQDIPAYVSIKGMDSDLDEIYNALPEYNQHDTLRFHRNGRNMAYIPAIFCKKNAAEFILKQLNVQPDDLVLTVGDSISDLPMMQTGTYAIAPLRSQLATDIFKTKLSE